MSGTRYCWGRWGAFAAIVVAVEGPLEGDEKEGEAGRPGVCSVAGVFLATGGGTCAPEKGLFEGNIFTEQS